MIEIDINLFVVDSERDDSIALKSGANKTKSTVCNKILDLKYLRMEII